MSKIESVEKPYFNADFRRSNADMRGYPDETIRGHPCIIRENPRLKDFFNGLKLGCRSMVGHENLGLGIVVRIHTSQPGMGY